LALRVFGAIECPPFKAAKTDFRVKFLSPYFWRVFLMLPVQSQIQS